LQLDIPRDRDNEFTPKIVPKHQSGIFGIEGKVIAVYASGMATRDIHDQIKEIYGVEISSEMVSRINDRVMP